MNSRRVAVVALLIAMLVAACSGGDDVPIVGEASGATVDDGERVSESAVTVTPTTVTTTTTTLPPTGSEVAELLGRGINFGNSLEGPREGDWGVYLEADFFRLIAEAGFDHIRLPVSWAAYADTEPPYTIPDGVDPNVVDQPYDNIWERVDWAIDQAEAHDLMIIVNMHHYDEAHADPQAHRDRIVAMWEQIAPRYADRGSNVVFELFNEPHVVYTEQPQLWNSLLVDLLAVVRETNPTRTVLVGPVGFNHVDYLDAMLLPDDDYLIATFHLYEPFRFTHQGAFWMDPIPPLGVPWTPDGLGLNDGLYDRSWDTRVITEDGALRLDFARQWAGFSVDYFEPTQFQEFSFTASGNGTVRVGCRVPGNDRLDEARITVIGQAQQFSIDLSSCPPEATGVSLMNALANPEPLWIADLVVCSEANGCENVMGRADDSLRRWLQKANEWSERTGVPVHLGEFGAFAAEGQVPMTDRVAWTETVVREADRLGIPFSYWEFHAGYAAYDVDQRRWNTDLLNALINPSTG